MTPFSGLLFFYVMGLLLLPAIVLGLLEKPLCHYGLVFTAAMLIFVFSQNGQLVALAVFYVWHMALCLLYPSIRKVSRRLLPPILLLALLPLAAVKLGELLPALRSIQLLGVSYMTFRSVQVLLDIHDGRLEKAQPLTLSYFLLFFPSVASGPIDRYQRFAGDLARKWNREEYIDLLRRDLWKLLFGAFSATVLSGMLYRFWALPPAGARFPHGPFLHVRLYLLPLLQLCRVQQHGNRHRLYARHRPAGKLPHALSQRGYEGFLVPLAHFALHLAAGLPLHPLCTRLAQGKAVPQPANRLLPGLHAEHDDDGNLARADAVLSALWGLPQPADVL